MIRQAVLAAAVVFGLSAAGCGGSGTTSESAVDVDATEYGFAMPDRIEGRVVSMHFRNTGREPHAFDFGRIDEGHSFAELKKLGEMEEVSWVHDMKGPPLLTPGAEITITRKLAPGTYYFACHVPNPMGIDHSKLGMARSFVVEGDSGEALPAPDAVITAEDDGFDVPELSAGEQTIELRNRASASREFELLTLNPGRTEADADRWFGQIEKTGRLPRTPAPVTFLGAMQDIPSGTSVFLTVDLDAGREYHIADFESGLEQTFTPT